MCPGTARVFQLPVTGMPDGSTGAVPVNVMRGAEEGPTLVAVAGAHGDEHVIVEPWIAGPPALDDAVKQAVARTLGPGEVFTSTMTGVLYSGVAGVSKLDRDGSVTDEGGPPALTSGTGDVRAC